MEIKLSIYFLFFSELLVVSWLDYKTKKISNWWSIANIVIVVIMLGFGSIGPLFSLAYFKIPVIFFGIAFLLYLLRVMGAGDVKFLTTLFLLLSINNQKYFLDGLLYATVLVGLMLLAINTIKHYKFIISCIATRTFHGFAGLFGNKFSYGPVILLAWIYLGWQRYQIN